MLSAMIIDDEAPARSELRFLLEETGRVQPILEAASAREAMERLKENRLDIDVLFMDISMPRTSGMELADGLNRMLQKPPAVVFVTAYSEYALDAFGVNAVDYLMKPVDPARLSQALDKVQARIKPAATTTQAPAERIPVEKSGRKVLIPVEEIRYIEAKDDYACIYTENARYLSTTSLARLEDKLAEHGFFRVHRSYIVNLKFVEVAQKVPSGTYLLEIQGIKDTKISVSRRKVPEVKALLNI